uniref:Sugar phosphate exchanger 3 n=1 Tax=Plectus sambesii TaxID=2011161 RepID=A0A914X938_9BILA
MNNGREERSGRCGRWVKRVLTGGESWTHHHLSVFLLTFSSYALFHATRKTMSTVKSSFIDQWMALPSNSSLPPSRAAFFTDRQDASAFLGLLDGAFLGAYAVGLFISGILGDRFEPRLVLTLGMWTSALMTFLFGTLTEWMSIYSKPFYMITWMLSGLVQSSGWPMEVCIMGNWFGHGSRGAVLGLWSACASVGNIIGTLLAAHFLHFGYEYTFLVNSSLLFAGGFVILFGMVSAPRDIGLADPAETKDEQDRVIEAVTERPKPISFLRAWLLPGVIAYSLAYACLKLVNYSFFFWLPYYLQNNFGWEESVADQLSVWYDWGGIVAGFVGGILTDHLSSRTPVVVCMLAISTAALFGYSKSPNDMTVNVVLMAITGFFVGGPANLISSAISADLGKAPELHGSAEALGTVTGIVDGTGSVGAALGQILVPLVQDWFSWKAVFYMFIFMMFGACACLTPLLVKEARQRRNIGYSQVSVDDEAAVGLLDPADDEEIT